MTSFFLPARLRWQLESALLISCASEEAFEERIDRRTEAADNVQGRRASRLDARQDRTDAWFDRAMN